MYKPKYNLGDVLFYTRYTLAGPVEVKLVVARIRENRIGEYIYYDEEDNDCFESEVIRVKH